MPRLPPSLLAGTLLVLLTAARAQSDARVEPSAEPATEPSAGPATDSGGWRLPPYLLGGFLALDLRNNRTLKQSAILPLGDSHSRLVTLGLSAASYLYQPWFATVSGTLNLSAGSSSASGEEGSRKDGFATGSLRMDLFPRSRFPLALQLDRSDTRVDSSNSAALDQRTQLLRVSQQYRPASGDYHLNTSYERRSQAGEGYDDLQNQLLSDFGTQSKRQSLALALALTRGERRRSHEHSEFSSISARHSLLGNADWNLHSSVNLTQNRDQLLFGATDLQVAQASSVALWRPTDSRLSVGASARLLQLHDARAQRDVGTLGASLSAAYELSERLRLNASASANQLRIQGVASRSAVANLGLGWQAETLSWRGLQYDRNAGASFGMARSGGRAERTGGVQLGHGLSRSWQPAESLELSATLSQSFGQQQRSGAAAQALAAAGTDPRTRQATNTLAFTASSQSGEHQAYARLSMSDAHELDGDRSRFQLINLQLSGSLELARYLTLNADITLQRSNQRAQNNTLIPGLPDLLPTLLQTRSNAGGGEIGLRHARLFGVPRLRFTSRFRLAQFVLHQSQALTPIPDRESRSWENRLDWDVGRLSSQLVHRESWVEGTRRRQLMWRLQRAFGD